MKDAVMVLLYGVNIFFILDDKLLIFGGINSTSYLGSHLFILNLNFGKVMLNDLEIAQKHLQEIGTNKNQVMKDRYEQMKSKKRKISIVKEFILPNIHDFYL